MATPDNGLAAVLYVENKVSAKVGEGTEVSIVEQSHYPFEEEIRFNLSTSRSVNFPLYLRVPGWCNSAEVLINGDKLDIHPVAGKFVRIERTWSDNDQVTLKVPMKLAYEKMGEKPQQCQH